MLATNQLSVQSPRSTFDIRDHLDQLTEDGGSAGRHETSYHCPVCEAPNFKVDHRSGRYGSYSCDCATTEEGKRKIRNAVAPQRTQKTYTPKQRRQWTYTDTNGKPLIRTVRLDDGKGEKEIWQEYCVNGQWLTPSRAEEKGIELDQAAYQNEVALLYYQEVQNAITQSLPIFIVEGEGVVDALRKLGLTATTNLMGSGKWKENYTKQLQGAKQLVIGPDRDTVGIKHAEAVADSLEGAGMTPQWLYAYPNCGLWYRLEDRNGLDLKDYLEDYPSMSADDLLNLIELHRRKFEFQYQTKTANEENDDKPKRLNKKQLLKFIRNHLNLRYNEMTREMELDGEVLEAEPYIYLLDHHNIDCGRDLAADLMMHVAKENSYNPVKEYLEKVSTIAPVSINNLATRYFGTDNPLFDTFLKKTLIAAVARMYEPGAQHDTVLILKGDQGLGKTNFFRVLAGDYFDNSFSGNNERDDLLNLHRAWFEEWGEVAKVFRKKEVDDLKHFITKTEDAFREPYGRKTQRYKRKCVIVGGVNDEEFLNDPTGDRRFWVIPLQQKVDLQLLKQERDRIWASAVQAYKAGETWWLSDEEEALNSQNNFQYRSSDEWQEIIEDYLSHQTVCTVRELLTEAFGYQAKDIAKRDQQRVANCLKAMGWKKTRRTYQGKRQSVWEATTATTLQGYGKSYGKAETPAQSEDVTAATTAITSEQNSCTNQQTEQTSQLNNEENHVSSKVCQQDMTVMADEPEFPTSKESEVVAPGEDQVVSDLADNDQHAQEKHQWVEPDAKPKGSDLHFGDYTLKERNRKNTQQ
ncbi:MAG: hypothetical protein GVY04_23800 [Cyanobacteria bacterium]|jgi:predicted P-loop ATPase|nr:hypothetical protein [Cyanobacteria bacterium GSL.Bin1]